MHAAILSLLGVGIPVALMIVYTVITGISPVPTSPEVLGTILSLLPEELLDGTVYELGSGWGHVAYALARKYRAYVVLGIELSVVPFAAAYLLRLVTRLPNLRFRRRNIFQQDLDDASLVLCYLHPPAMRRLAPKLGRELRPGTWVVCNYFEIPGWKPERVVRAPDQYESPVYVYRVPDGGGAPGAGAEPEHRGEPEDPPLTVFPAPPMYLREAET